MTIILHSFISRENYFIVVLMNFSFHFHFVGTNFNEESKSMIYRKTENCDIDIVENSSSLLLFFISAALLIPSSDSFCILFIVDLGPYNCTLFFGTGSNAKI